jgi:CDP-6-deoxy-D-xylo-4-hexulose-3-dehydrase
MIIKENSLFSRTDLQIFLEKRNIQTRVVFTGNILRQPGYKNINCIGVADDFINADRVMAGGILLALHHGLTNEMIKHIQNSITLFLDQYQ